MIDTGVIGRHDPERPADAPRCSRAECRNEAQWQVNWRNPRIHSADRVKVWLACADHAGYLRDYLTTRGFPVVLTPLGTIVDRVPDAEAT